MNASETIQVGLELRRATSADRAALATMYESFEPKATALGLPPRHNAASWLERLSAYPNFVVVAEGRVAGHAVLCPEGDSAEVAVFVHQDYRSRGLGKLLLAELVREGQRLGLRQMWGVTPLDNLPMLRLARSLGFVTGDDPETFFLDLERMVELPSAFLPAA